MNSIGSNIETVSIIPQPVSIQHEPGQFQLNRETIIQIIGNDEVTQIGSYLKQLISIPTGFDFEIRDEFIDDSVNTIQLQTTSDLQNLGSEGYRLEITPQCIIISAAFPAGIFYGVQSLRLLLPIEIERRTFVDINQWILPCLAIEDYPRFSWRGFMLDEGRFFLGKVFVKRMLDLLALHKMNTFHWHLTEDQGWRIEIKKYPRLVEIGSKRIGTQIGGIRSYLTKKIDYTPHHGYYTQEDLKEIITYAKERFIQVIPEIDMPGHSMAALAAYPELSCTGGPFQVQTTFGIKKDVFCPGKERVYQFINDIIDEILEIFPTRFIHIGGDEVPKTRWKECPNCQAKLKSEAINDEEELQTYFVNRIASYLVDRGRIPICWNDILADDLIEAAIGQHWLWGDKKVLSHLRKGRKFVISRFFYTYLDYPYTMTPLRKAYAFEPLPKKLEEEYHGNVLGLEAPMWTEWAPNLARLDWQIFPRLTAYAETAWSRQIDKNYTSFKKRLVQFLQRLDVLGVRYAQLKFTDPGFFKRIFSLLGIFRDPQRNITRIKS